jgi:tetratricopeptide (TPR) repeat protein
MISLLVVALAGFILFRLLGGVPMPRRKQRIGSSTAAKIEELTEYASKLRSVNNYPAAEKVYLEILKLDHRHAETYSRLGTLYSTMKNPVDAIECFQIASQLNPTGATLHNLGLAYYENQNPMKAIAALEKSVMFEPTVQRHLALAKALRKMGRGDQMIAALEQAANLDPTTKVLWLLADAYAAAGNSEEQERVYERIRRVDPKDKRMKSIDKVTAVGSRKRRRVVEKA